MKYLIFFTLIFSIFSCTDYRELGNNYFISDEYDAIDQGSPYGSFVYKGKGHYGSIEVINKIVVRSKILYWEKEKEYVLIKQEFDSMNMKKILKEDFGLIIEKSKEDAFDLDLPHGKVSLPLYEKLKSLKTNTPSQLSQHLDKIVDSVFLNTSYYRDRMKNRYNYYLLNTSTEKLEGPFNYLEIKEIIEKSTFKFNLH